MVWLVEKVYWLRKCGWFIRYETLWLDKNGSIWFVKEKKFVEQGDSLRQWDWLWHVIDLEMWFGWEGMVWLRNRDLWVYVLVKKIIKECDQLGSYDFVNKGVNWLRKRDWFWRFDWLRQCINSVFGCGMWLVDETWFGLRGWDCLRMIGWKGVHGWYVLTGCMVGLEHVIWLRMCDRSSSITTVWIHLEPPDCVYLYIVLNSLHLIHKHFCIIFLQQCWFVLFKWSGNLLKHSSRIS
jgi:hypothetical protein